MLQEMFVGPVNLSNELNYQQGGIVSRVLLKQPSGSVTAFAFEQ